jgi:branched-subunit amino acid transport protein
MSVAWVVIIGLAAGVYVVKAAAPLALGNRRLPAGVERLTALLPAALLAALVVVSTVDGARRLQVDARLVGVAAAAIALWRKATFIVVVVIAAATTALVRLL